jgi:hypothetical protein
LGRPACSDFGWLKMIDVKTLSDEELTEMLEKLRSVKFLEKGEPKKKTKRVSSKGIDPVLLKQIVDKYTKEEEE